MPDYLLQVGMLACKFLDSQGTGYLSSAAECIDWCASQGASVISASFGGYGSSQTLYNAIQRFDGLFVAAAGNEGRSLDSNYPVIPASYNLPNLLAVAATG